MIDLRVILALLYMFIRPAPATTVRLFVSPHGDNSASGTSAQTPLHSLVGVAQRLASSNIRNRTFDAIAVRLAPGVYAPLAHEPMRVSLVLPVETSVAVAFKTVH